MSTQRLYSQRLTSLSVRINETADDEILLVQVAPVRDGERLVSYGVLDGAPDVDNADAGFQEAFSFVGEVIFNAFDGRLVRLIDVDLSLWCFEQASTVYRKTCRSGAAHYRATLLRVILVLGVTVTPAEANMSIQTLDSQNSSTWMDKPDSMVKNIDTFPTRHFFQDPFNFGVILRLDHLVVCEVLFDARPVHPLEAVLVQ